MISPGFSYWTRIYEVWLFLHPSDKDPSLGAPVLAEKPRNPRRLHLHLQEK
jgi:hypothetical protein